MKTMERIGVQELVQHAGRYVERARHGETIDIIDGGTAVARLAPVPDDDASLDVLIAQGLVTPPSGDLDELLSAPGVAVPAASSSTEEHLRELREERL